MRVRPMNRTLSMLIVWLTIKAHEQNQFQIPQHMSTLWQQSGRRHMMEISAPWPTWRGNLLSRKSAINTKRFAGPLWLKLKQVYFRNPQAGMTLLHHAAWNGRELLIGTLLKKGSKIEATTELNHTPLWMACKAGRVETAHRLATYGANPFVMDQFVRSPSEYLWFVIIDFHNFEHIVQGESPVSLARQTIDRPNYIFSRELEVIIELKSNSCVESSLFLKELFKKSREPKVDWFTVKSIVSDDACCSW